VRIAARFNGPAQSGHGGYSAGLMASALPEPDRGVRVRLRQPPPLDTELAVTPTADGIEVYAGDQLIAAAQPAVPGAVLAGPLPAADAERASARYAGHADHPFPTCFGCGPARSPGDGLRVFAGPVGDGRTAAVWTAPADVSPLLVWAALDCPGGWTIVSPGRPYVLGQLTAVVDAVPAPGQRCVVMGEAVETGERKSLVRTALWSPAGDLLAHAEAVWVALPASR
jgi:hypothetical protein